MRAASELDCVVAVVAEDSQRWVVGESELPQLQVEAARVASEGPPMFLPVAVDVVEMKEVDARFSTAGAATPVSDEYFKLQLTVVLLLAGLRDDRFRVWTGRASSFCPVA
jgi:hypothetical protein